MLDAPTEQTPVFAGSRNLFRSPNSASLSIRGPSSAAPQLPPRPRASSFSRTAGSGSRRPPAGVLDNNRSDSGSTNFHELNRIATPPISWLTVVNDALAAPMSARLPGPRCWHTDKVVEDPWTHHHGVSVGIAERNACSSVARGAMMRASSARRRGRWGRWTACACRGRSGRPR